MQLKSELKELIKLLDSTRVIVARGNGDGSPKVVRCGRGHIYLPEGGLDRTAFTIRQLRVLVGESLEWESLDTHGRRRRVVRALSELSEIFGGGFKLVVTTGPLTFEEERVVDEAPQLFARLGELREETEGLSDFDALRLVTGGKEPSVPLSSL